MKKRYVIPLFSMLVLIASAVAGIIWEINKLQQKIIIKNNSSEVIQSITVSFLDEKLQFQDVMPGNVIEEKISAASDGDFDINVVHNDGTVKEKNNVGYITNADGSDTIIKINQQKEIEFDQEY